MINSTLFIIETITKAQVNHSLTLLFYLKGRDKVSVIVKRNFLKIINISS